MQEGEGGLLASPCFSCSLLQHEHGCVRSGKILCLEGSPVCGEWNSSEWERPPEDVAHLKTDSSCGSISELFDLTVS